ncbi:MULTISPECIES: Cof-type HAD-IIB family hydrolase [unclassified Lonepinella]|uniref:Cof-type HAD-IIB family hydrolase n=1 Tax=unclassified Lonepinella TaxID=2642006 RepID=UPI0036DF2396
MNLPNLSDQIKIVFFDIDETLIVKDKDFLPESVLPSIQKLQQKGIIAAIATGRSPCSFPPKIKALVKQAGMNTFVTMNGQYVVHQGNVVDKLPIPPQKITEVVAFFESVGFDYTFVSNEHLAVSAITDQVRSALDPLQTDYHIDKNYYQTHDVFQILPFYDESKDQLVANSGVLKGLKTVRWHEQSVDLFDAQGSKARGILHLLKHLNLSIENAMAFGDGLNDLEMLSTVGVGVAMGNACDELKAVADFETDHIERDGIYRFLHQTGLID